MQAGVCHWRPIYGASPLDIREKKASWTGLAAFAVTPGEVNEGIRLQTKGHDGSLCSPLFTVNDENRTPAVLHPEWWGTTVQDEEGINMPVSTWCSSLREAIDEAASSPFRGIDNRHASWEDHWWMIWELTLWSDTITSLVNMNSISPVAIVATGPTRWDPATKTCKPLELPTIKAWNISRPIDMATLTGWHQPHKYSADALGKCEKYLVKQRCVWEDVKIRGCTKLVTGACTRWGCQELTGCRSYVTELVDGLGSRCFNELRGRETYAELSDHSEWILDSERPSPATGEDMSEGELDVD